MKSESEKLAQQIVAILKERQETLATAESCTGGLIAEAITRVPGASDVFWGGVIVYADETKIKLLGVPTKAITQHGAVSEQVAFHMARGAQKRLATTWAVSVTGISGPSGGSKEKPVGTTCFGLATPSGVFTTRVLLKDKGRLANREQSANVALKWILHELSRA